MKGRKIPWTPESDKANASYSIPKTFRCHVGGEWKPLSSFAETQQHKIRRQIDQRLPIDAAWTKMTCREHQAKPKDELKCAFCSTVKHLSEYSKSSRKTAEPKCRMCVAWIEIQEPQVTPGFLLNSHMSPDEERKEIRNRPLQQNDDFLLNIDDHVEAVSVLDSIGQSTEDGGITDVDSCENRTVTTLPPHLRAKVTGAARPTPQPSSPSPSVSSRTTSIATTYISFNGWDNQGGRHRQTRRQEWVASSASTAGRRDENVIGDWSHAGLNPDPGTKENDTRRGAWGRPGPRLTAQELRGETDWTSNVPRTPFIKREFIKREQY